MATDVIKSSLQVSKVHPLDSVFRLIFLLIKYIDTNTFLKIILFINFPNLIKNIYKLILLKNYKWPWIRLFMPKYENHKLP